jgi:hypothetical protein
VSCKNDFVTVPHLAARDMLDRIDTRSALKSFGWDSQMGTSDLRNWRERVAAVSTLPHPEEPPLICRSIRGFVGVKGSS